MNKNINIEDFNYILPDERIAKFPLGNRDDSKLLLYTEGNISHTIFNNIANHLPDKSLLIFNNTKVIRARLMFFKETGARIEIFCLEPYQPADYERAFSTYEPSKWLCMIGNLKKWKDNLILKTSFEHNGMACSISAKHCGTVNNLHIVEFSWSDTTLSFGQMLELLGTIPIPPYLNRDSCEQDNVRYQNVYSKFEGSVAAPTAGLHFTTELITSLTSNTIQKDEITLHVGAGTFLPVKSDNAAAHVMHTEHFEINISTLKNILDNSSRIIAVGTTSVRTLESVSVLGYRIMKDMSPFLEKPVGQWEAYDIPKDITGYSLIEAVINYMQCLSIEKISCSTQIMITPGYIFRVVNGLITNFHQPKSTLLLLISAFIGNSWREVYKYAMDNEFRFLSYGDSSLLFAKKL